MLHMIMYTLLSFIVTIIHHLLQLIIPYYLANTPPPPSLYSIVVHGCVVHSVLDSYIIARSVYV